MIMEKPVLSPNFTIDDIHKLREYHYEATKDMSKAEKMDYYNGKGRKFFEELKEGNV